jgi:hypothetical protein
MHQFESLSDVTIEVEHLSGTVSKLGAMDRMEEA